MTDNDEREQGFYWVQCDWRADPIVAEWDGFSFFVPGVEEMLIPRGIYRSQRTDIPAQPQNE